MASVYIWRDGQSFIAADPAVLAAGKWGRERAWRIVRSNGVVWSVTLAPTHHGVLPPGEEWKADDGLLLPVSWRLPLAWARRQPLALGQAAQTPAPPIAASVVLPYPSPATAPLGGVAYVGFETVRKRSVHALESLHRAVNAAVLQAARVWAWTPRALEVHFHESERKMGLAYAPGSPFARVHQLISLNVRLLAGYDLNSVARLVLHELCHHYREERWPRGPRRSQRTSHDERFCAALMAADAEVRDARTCEFFTSDEDPAAVAVVRAKTEKGVAWSPDLGVVFITRAPKGRDPYWRWDPRTPGAWRTRQEPFTAEALIALLRRFPRADWPRVEVVHTPLIRGGLTALKSLADLAEWLAVSARFFGAEGARLITEFLATYA